ncbi:unnamed protein product [Euphydryas editha]|uniref:Lipase domain-containing protein n=1 Tax=Euphydryas editha TaxID=104508 RepID=A0AAU9VCZ0_EUPED|nr:unnamed protein product [Euphydryas editha]
MIKSKPFFSTLGGSGSFGNYSVFSLNDPVPILSSSAYRPERKTVFYVFGFGGKAEEKSVQTIVEVYLGIANICLLNWEKEASTGILGPISYPLTAISNAKRIGNEFGESLIKLHNAGLNLTDVHVIGFSLGGQLVGYTGRKVQEYDNILSRITGLEPAGPLYDGIISLRGLGASDASFVDIIHTNPNRLGSGEATGSVDIWVNCENSVQPGCDGSNFGMFIEKNLCSHDLSWKYFAEAIEHPSAYVARSASSCEEWRSGQATDQTVFMGDEINTEARGSFYLRTNSEPPYGLGEDGSHPSS